MLAQSSSNSSTFATQLKNAKYEKYNNNKERSILKNYLAEIENISER